MRNWNVFLVSSTVPPYFCFYSTYEELKLPLKYWDGLSPAGFYSTYEELKHPVYVVYNHMFSFVFTVPMRNWNISICFLISLNIYSFYSTYEELKQILLTNNISYFNMFLQYLWGIETLICATDCDFMLSRFYSTYEELKPIAAYIKVIFWRRFYSTYEELKHALALEYTFRWCKFLQYLWGIETIHQQRNPKPYIFRFYSTYEELKLSVWTSKKSSIFVFTVPMRNWNIPTIGSAITV